jgi:hypothetical protein
MLEIFVENYKPIGKILLITGIFLTVCILIFFKQTKEHLRANWSEYKTHPFILPFAGLLNPEEGKSFIETTLSNFLGVMSSIVGAIFKILCKPINPILNIFSTLLQSFSKILEKIRLQLSVIRGFLFKLFENILLRLQDGIAAIVYFFLKLRESLKRSFGLFSLLISTAEHIQFFFESMLKGPVGAAGDLAGSLGWVAAIFTFWNPYLGPIPGQLSWSYILCFEPNSQILTNTGVEYIKNIKIGDLLLDDNVVLSKIISKYDNSTIHRLNGTNVTGDHIVKLGDRWIRVKDHPMSTIVNTTSTNLVCLITSNGTISTTKNIYRDYLDTHCPQTNKKIDIMVENFINNSNVISSSHTSQNLVCGISKDIRVLNDDISGVVYINPGSIKLYQIDGYYLSEKILILENGIWKRVPIHSRAIDCGYLNIKCVHYITKSEKIYLDNGLIIRDFTESRDDQLNDAIDKMVIINLNNTLTK